MSSEQIVSHDSTKSKLDQFKLDFEFNRSLSDERKMVKRRADKPQ